MLIVEELARDLLREGARPPELLLPHAASDRGDGDAAQVEAAVLKKSLSSEERSRCAGRPESADTDDLAAALSRTRH
jgi:hypothetical protein